jgi:RNA polymerase-binding protein DksA
MDAEVRASLAEELRRQRAALLKEVADTEFDLQFIAQDRESELEERAQEERAARLLARLDDRSRRAIDAIHAALQRMIDGAYGRCADCEGPIPIARLQALPATTLCVACARRQEVERPPTGEEVEIRHPGRLPPDASLLSDGELEEALRELVRQDHRVDTEELRIICRHGVVHLDGALPSEAEHQILRKLVTDVAGLEEVVDRVQVNELLWERGERARKGPRAGEPRRYEPIGTEDVVESTDEGLGFLPPAGPPPEEE